MTHEGGGASGSIVVTLLMHLSTSDWLTGEGLSCADAARADKPSAIATKIPATATKLPARSPRMTNPRMSSPCPAPAKTASFWPVSRFRDRADDRDGPGSVSRRPPTFAGMPTEEKRTAAAASLRELSHSFAAHDPDDDVLEELGATATRLARGIEQAPLRDRVVLMRKGAEGSIIGGGVGFEDRAVGGSANPTGVELDVRFEGDEVVATVVLRKAFEGAPGRAHGGIVAAAFDDITGFVIGMIQAPAFTGELTVRYLAPVPVDEPLEIRARLDGRERRKLFISAEARRGDVVIATCRATYITVDPARFAGAPDPR
jgi:acyl-coenzyme A thioesterase PaaI-like protein